MKALWFFGCKPNQEQKLPKVVTENDEKKLASREQADAMSHLERQEIKSGIDVKWCAELITPSVSNLE